MASRFFPTSPLKQEYEENAQLDIYVSKLFSTRVQIPFKYYHLKFCTPFEIKDIVPNIGVYLEGDPLQNTPYEVTLTRFI